MWEIDNRSPFASLGYFVRDKGGLKYWVVAVRARFAIAEDGFSWISDSQGDIRLRPEYGDLPSQRRKALGNRYRTRLPMHEL